MRYLPKSPSERRQMLEAIGVRSIEELFASIPEALRLNRPLDLPGPLSEAELIQYFRDRAAENSVGYSSFLGAGVYNHLRSVVTDTILLRGEFLTSYTPYQAEISQGTLQAIFEFQTLMAELTGQEVANASMWDGSTATTEAVLMAERLTRRRRVLVARSVHPEYRQVLATYARNLNLQIGEIGYMPSGQIDLDALRSAMNNEIGAVLAQSPNFFGALEPVSRIAEVARGAEALTIVAVAEAVSLGVVRPPAEADIVSAETQSFGMPPSYGGPYAGVIAAREKYVRQMPGRLAGLTTDGKGRRGFCLTLATREQHIRRERATSNICTNQALCALAATVHLCLLGKQGLREMAEQNVAKARFAMAELEKLPGVHRVFDGPVFNEFVLQFPRSVRMINAQLLRDKIIGPLPLGQYYPELTKCGLVCVTETTRREQIERLADAVRETLAVPV
ncbi:MAG TPA: aminomethyl-transferring glycine dehydrogenase subunit GcvPA [Candidatus Acidoferrales bacterium]|nr:aminomethyl-transferring glycine dehydrogenase subunit GcvPA [Candidatus Acidoferrales bacterium]